MFLCCSLENVLCRLRRSSRRARSRSWRRRVLLLLKPRNLARGKFRHAALLIQPYAPIRNLVPIGVQAKPARQDRDLARLRASTKEYKSYDRASAKMRNSAHEHGNS